MQARHKARGSHDGFIPIYRHYGRHWNSYGGSVHSVVLADGQRAAAL
jgi:hypothetical protein